MTIEEHAKVLRPSSAHQWRYCPASAKLQNLFPDSAGDEADEGEAVHWVGSSCLTNRALSPEVLVGQTAPNGVLITTEMADRAKTYVDVVVGICTDRGLFQGLRVETPVRIPRVHPECWGTPDADAYDDNKRILHIWDYKDGWGIVEAYENWQCIAYALGALDRIKGFGNPNFDDTTMAVHMHVVQPKPYHPEGAHRVWKVKASDLRGYANQLESAAHPAMSDKAETVSGPHCRYCTARHACPAAHRSAMVAVDVIDQNIPHELDPASLSATIQTLRRAEQMVKWLLDAHEAQAVARIKAGEQLPIYGLGTGRPSQVWASPKEAIASLGDLYGIDVRKPMDIKTPKQALDAGMPEELVKKYSKFQNAKIKLIEIDKLAKKVFSQ